MIGVGIVGRMGWGLKVSHDWIVFLSLRDRCSLVADFLLTLLVLVEGPRIVRLAAVVDKGIKKGSALDVNVFGSICKSDF